MLDDCKGHRDSLLLNIDCDRRMRGIISAQYSHRPLVKVNAYICLMQRIFFSFSFVFVCYSTALELLNRVAPIFRTLNECECKQLIIIVNDNIALA